MLYPLLLFMGLKRPPRSNFSEIAEGFSIGSRRNMRWLYGACTGRLKSLNLSGIALKRLQMPWKQKLYTQQEKVSRFYYFFPYFELFPTIDISPIQTLTITLLRNPCWPMPRELGLPVFSLGATIIVSKNCPTIGEHLVIILVTQ